MLKYSGNFEMPLTSTLTITMPNEDAPITVGRHKDRPLVLHHA